MLPALNVRGIKVGGVRELAANAIPTEASASIDFRLVPNQTPERVKEIYFVRQHLLSLVGRLVAERATDEERADLRERLTQMRADAASGDVDSYFWGHVALQERMTEIAGNETLKGILDSLALRTLILRHASLAQPGRLLASVKDQERILEAIEQRDGELAAILLSRATVAAFGAIEMSAWSELQSQASAAAG